FIDAIVSAPDRFAPFGPMTDDVRLLTRDWRLLICDWRLLTVFVPDRPCVVTHGCHPCCRRAAGRAPDCSSLPRAAGSRSRRRSRALLPPDPGRPRDSAPTRLRPCCRPESAGCPVPLLTDCRLMTAERPVA